MDRREFFVNLGMSGVILGVLAQGAEAAVGETMAVSASKRAFDSLASALSDMEVHLTASLPEKDRAEARRYVLHVLQAGLRLHFEADPARPRFTRFVDPDLKLLGDNPDALYYSAPIDPARRYRIKGNLAGALYTSFSVEKGTAEGSMSQRVLATLNDTQFEHNADGSFEIIAGGRHQSRNWLALDQGAGSITTRHYFEREDSAAADPRVHIPLLIEPLDAPGLPQPPSEESVAAGCRRVTNFLRSVIGMAGPQDPARAPIYYGREPNVFPLPAANDANKAVGFAAADNVYLSTEYRLEPGEALIMRGRFPPCRFANVLLFNRFLQTFDYAHRRISLNRRQTKLEADGSFRVIIAGSDPHLPNWIDTEGRPAGRVFWRFLLPEGPIEPVTADRVKIGDLPRG